MVQYPDDHHKGTTPENNLIPTIFVGAHVKAKPDGYNEWINHYNILRTLEDMYKLDYMGISASMQPITDVWQ
jgi:phosphatidylinositol-3-phosphatase